MNVQMYAYMYRYMYDWVLTLNHSQAGRARPGGSCKARKPGQSSRRSNLNPNH